MAQVFCADKAVAINGGIMNVGDLIFKIHNEISKKENQKFADEYVRVMVNSIIRELQEKGNFTQEHFSKELKAEFEMASAAKKAA